MQVILIDDENKALSMLSNRIVEMFPDVEILEEIMNPEIAADRINELNPDAVFVDLSMPRVSGIEVIESIQNPDTIVVITTAHDPQNFDLEHVSEPIILLKPISRSELQSVVDEIRQRMDGDLEY